jgi:class 3 adenylate cyclase
MSVVPDRPHLVLPSGERFVLDGNVTIGRSALCSIPLEGEKVSRDHSHIYEVGGLYQVVDSQSRNGTYLNGTRLNRPTTLDSGDRITIGGHVLYFYQGIGLALSPGTNLNSAVTLDALDQTAAWLLLLDIKESTDLTIRFGLEKYAALLGDWFRKCRSVIELNGGTINKSTGDGLLAFWKDPDADFGELLALAMTGLYGLHKGIGCPAFRMVVHYGPVGFGGAAGLGEEPLAGSNVHLLFRAEKIFGQLDCTLGATEAAAKFLKPWLNTSELGEFVLKGFEGEHPLFRLDVRSEHAPSSEKL